MNIAAIVATVEQAVTDCALVVGTTSRERRFGWPVMGPAELMPRLDETPGELAIVFGPEDTGLSNEDLRLCDILLRLPTSTHPSLNLSMAASVIGAWLLGAPERNILASLSEEEFREVRARCLCAASRRRGASTRRRAER